MRDAYQRHVYDLLAVVRWHDALAATTLPSDDWPSDVVDYESTAFRLDNGDETA